MSEEGWANRSRLALGIAQYRRWLGEKWTFLKLFKLIRRAQYTVVLIVMRECTIVSCYFSNMHFICLMASWSGNALMLLSLLKPWCDMSKFSLSDELEWERICIERIVLTAREDQIDWWITRRNDGCCRAIPGCFSKVVSFAQFRSILQTEFKRWRIT